MLPKLFKACITPLYETASEFVVICIWTCSRIYLNRQYKSITVNGQYYLISSDYTFGYKQQTVFID